MASSQPQPGSHENYVISQILDVLKKLQELQNPINRSNPPDPNSAGNGSLVTSTSVGNPPSGGSGSDNLVGNTQLGRTQSTPLPQRNEVSLDELIRKIQSHVSQLKRDGIKLEDLQHHVEKELRRHLTNLTQVLEELNSTRRHNVKEDLKDISRNIFNLMCQVPLLPDKQKKGASDAQEDDEYRGGRVDVYLPGIYKNKADLAQTETYESVIKNFKNLDIQHMLCLLSFAVFPENGVMNKTMLMYWWMAEGFLPVEDAGTLVVKILDDFKKMGLIEPVEDERKMEPASYKMPPLVHSTVVLLSTSIGLYDIYDKNWKPAMKGSEKKKVCLVEGSSSKDETKVTKMQPGDIETVFNVSERFPDFTFKWFKLMKTLKVLYLGRWERTAKRHIEVESPELMKNLSSLSELRLLSLQGISRIERLDDSVCKLRKLIILDLRACYNLEKLPEKIDSLENLIYLDISECYMIDRMPKRLAWLEKLEVLKGFVVSDADEETTCRLIDLKHLVRLKKLSVTINKTDFDMNKLKEALVGLKALENLKVAWGSISKDQKEKKTGMDHQAKSVMKNAVKALFRQRAGRHGEGPANPGYRLHKLDLQCFPDAKLPEWLQPRNLITLKKLYIKGGTELSGLGELPMAPTHCGVEVLRLKFLPKLQVEWRDLKGLYFPKLVLLEKYQCPRVALCPCDGKGIWKVNKP